MYCRNCGKQMADDNAFCSSCGTSTNVQTQPNQSRSANNETLNNAGDFIGNTYKLISSKGIYTVSSIGASIIFIILLLTKWVNIPLLQYVSSLFGGSSNTGSYSILKLLVSLKGIATNQYLPNSSRVFMVFLILILTGLWVISVYSLSKYIYEYLSQNNIYTDKLKTGMTSIIILFAVSFIGMLIVNSTVSDKTYGMYSQVLSLTGKAYFTGIAAILARIILVKKLDEEISLQSSTVINTDI